MHQNTHLTQSLIISVRFIFSPPFDDITEILFFFEFHLLLFFLELLLFLLLL